MPLTHKPLPFVPALVAGAPNEAGVYALWGNEELLYIGRANGARSTIRALLIDHLAGLHGPCSQRATHYQWELSLAPEAREVELLEEYRARFQRLPRCNGAR